MNTAILIPVFNTPSHHLLETVQSIRSQTDAPILIVDDGSTSVNTIAGLSILEDCFLNIEVHRLPENMGTPTALNIGHQLLKEMKWVALCGSSDLWMSGKFAAQIQYLKTHPETDVLGTGLQAFRDGDVFRSKYFSFVHPEKPLPRIKKDPKDKQHPYFLTNHGTVIYRNEAVLSVGGYDVNYKRAQDVELWSRMWANKSVFRNINKVFYLWRR